MTSSSFLTSEGVLIAFIDCCNSLLSDDLLSAQLSEVLYSHAHFQACSIHGNGTIHVLLYYW